MIDPRAAGSVGAASRVREGRAERTQKVNPAAQNRTDEAGGFVRSKRPCGRRPTPEIPAPGAERTRRVNRVGRDRTEVAGGFVRSDRPRGPRGARPPDRAERTQFPGADRSQFPRRANPGVQVSFTLVRIRAARDPACSVENLRGRCAWLGSRRSRAPGGEASAPPRPQPHGPSGEGFPQSRPGPKRSDGRRAGVPLVMRDVKELSPMIVMGGGIVLRKCCEDLRGLAPIVRDRCPSPSAGAAREWGQAPREDPRSQSPGRDTPPHTPSEEIGGADVLPRAVPAQPPEAAVGPMGALGPARGRTRRRGGYCEGLPRSSSRCGEIGWSSGRNQTAGLPCSRYCRSRESRMSSTGRAGPRIWSSSDSAVWSRGSLASASRA